MPSVSAALLGQSSGRAIVAFCIGLLTILGAYGFQYIGGYVPCELCLGQRVPYYVGLPILAIVIAAWRIVPRPVRIVGCLLVMAIFLWGCYLGAYHAGVEWKFWPGPTSCTGAGGGISFSDLNDINATRVVPCDEVQWRFAGLSFAGYNALISLLIAALLAWSALGQLRRGAAE
jgi:disulfide bond formation protein DsbB